MSARDEILGRVRSALADAPELPTARVPLRRPDRLTDLVELFCDRVADYRAEVERCPPEELDARLRAVIPDGARVVVPEGLGLDVAGSAVVDRALSAAALDRLDAVVTRARLGIAETGTIVLDHGPGQGRRAITLVPDHHVCIVEASQVVADVPDAFAVLDTTRPLTWVSGPSATSDIELDRVEGVHGPRHLHVIVVT
ncbi:MAG TPA: lactate utilization protein C [Nocardioides sp.]|uniref:LutC/YkgG family protein n=1 Tax=Nocardioides sp. TaxID=35761 RepID=UPI002E36182F|nr:lactate utilization protein C [Nocardioides sp.]HEX3932720.1 lactate utilization protein C [Nocardioides sp.]